MVISVLMVIHVPVVAGVISGFVTVVGVALVLAIRVIGSRLKLMATHTMVLELGMEPLTMFEVLTLIPAVKVPFRRADA